MTRRDARSWSLALSLAASVAGCFDDYGRGADASAADASAPDAHGPRVLEERCRIAWAREVPVPDAGLGFVADLEIVTVDGEQRVLTIVWNDATTAFGDFAASTGVGALGPTHLVAMARSGDRVFAVAREAVGTQARFVEIDTRDGHELRVLGTVEADEVRSLEADARDESVVLSFSVFEQFGLVEATPRPRGTQVILRSTSAGLEVVSLGTYGALLSMPDGATIASAFGTQLCVDGTCRDAPGNRHVIHDDGRLESGDDPGRSFAAIPRAAGSSGDGTWIELALGSLARWGPDGNALRITDVPSYYNVFELDIDRARTRAVTHTRVGAGTPLLSDDVAIPASDEPRGIYIVWALPALTPLYFTAAAAPVPSRSGPGYVRIGDDERRYVSFIADPALDVCGRRFERSIGVIAID